MYCSVSFFASIYQLIGCENEVGWPYHVFKLRETRLSLDFRLLKDHNVKKEIDLQFAIWNLLLSIIKLFTGQM